MKNVFAFAAALLSTSLFSNDQAFATSQSYTSLVENGGGYVTIMNPWYKENETTYQFSNDSSLDGICRLYGFDHVSKIGAKTQAVVGFDYILDSLTARISADGTFAGLNRKKVNPIRSIVCASKDSESRTPSVSYKEMNGNDDGSVTLVLPKVQFSATGARALLLSGNDTNMICRLFGFSEYANYLVSGYREPYDSFAAIVDRSGKVIELNDGEEIQAISCR